MLLPLLAAVLAVAPGLNARAMLGDSGANLLGAALGAVAVLHLSFPAQIALLFLWCGVNILSEFISISALIEKSGWLRYLDLLGRTGNLKFPWAARQAGYNLECRNIREAVKGATGKTGNLSSAAKGKEDKCFMIRRRVGTVQDILSQRGLFSEIAVFTEGEHVKAVNYIDLTGPAYPGDQVLLNNTALHLGLGTGGYDFVYHNFSRPLPPFGGSGHIIKLRYTPWQIRVLGCEEEAAGNQEQLAAFRSLQGTPVLIGELHSILAPAAAVIKQHRPSCRLVYLMTDGGALPLHFSRTVAELREKGLLSGTVTCGHAFGGDLEAVNVYSALAASRRS